jgi:CheY-like chemotaxis protein
MEHTGVNNFGRPRKRVLVVEDDGWIRRFMRDLLLDEGYEVLEAADGRTAIRLASELLPDVLLLDVTMPDFNGVDVLRYLRSRRRTRSLPVIVVSAYPRVLPRDAVVAVSCVLVKPVEVDLLLETLRSVVEPASVASGVELLEPVPA